jgi:hypothetical protein
MDSPLNKLSIESKIIKFGVRSKRLWHFLLGYLSFSSGPAEIPNIFAKTPKVLEISKNFVEISKFFEKRQMLTLSGNSGDFCGVYESILNLTASFWVRRISGDSET